MIRLVPLAALVLWGSISTPSITSAQSAGRIVVERFEGSRARRWRAMLVEDLRDAGYEIVGDREIARARRRLDLPRNLDEEDYARLAAVLQARAFVSGSSARARRQLR